MRSILSCLALAFLCMIGPVLHAQARPLAYIEYALGNDIVIIRNGQRLAYRDVLGLDLFAGDLIQTGRGNAAELRFSRDQALLRVTENTSFSLEDQGGGQPAVRLLYGRIRAKVERMANSDSFAVLTSTAVVAVRGTDFGYDYVAGRLSPAPQALVYCFDGLLDVTALVESPATRVEGLEPVLKRFSLESGMLLAIDSAGSDADKMPLSPSLVDFWRLNDFNAMPGLLDTYSWGGSASSTAPDQAEPAQAQPAQSEPKTPRASEPEQAPQAALVETRVETRVEYIYVPDEAYAARVRRAAAHKEGGVVAGSMMLSLGLGLEIYAFYLQSQGRQDEANQYALTGAMVTGAALPFFLVTFLIRP